VITFTALIELARQREEQIAARARLPRPGVISTGSTTRAWNGANGRDPAAHSEYDATTGSRSCHR
jgi:hypothetical protein